MPRGGYSIYLAATYSGGAYGSSTYDGTTAASTGASIASNTSDLTNTGIAVASITTIAVAILLIALAVRIWKHPGKHTKAQRVGNAAL